VRETLSSALRFVGDGAQIHGARVVVAIGRQAGGDATHAAAVNWEPEAGENEALRADFCNGSVKVALALKAPVKADELSLLAELLAQQIARWAAVRVLAEENENLRAAIRSAEDSVLLAKLVHRATSLIAARSGLSEREAKEWLVSAAARHERPLLNVARDVVTVLSAGTLGFDAAA
jgi:hypothetical protein